MTDELDTQALAGRFPADFIWGLAASAYQVEGAASEDGRGVSIWDTFSRQPGAVVNGDTGDVACDHYHRYREDVRLMADVGASAYRFSISWPRWLPVGTGAVNQRGVDFYQRLVDELLGAGVQPMVNLFHWDLPQALQDRGGFANPEVVGWFTDYTALIVSAIGDRVVDWMTFNEPAVFAFLAHADGIHAPGMRHWPTAMRVADNQLRAHAAAVQVIRSGVPGARIGVAIDVNQAVPATDSDRDRVAAQLWHATRDWWFLDPLFGRGYPKDGLEGHRAAGHLEGVDLADPPPGDLDYVGLNYYRRETVSANSDVPFDWEAEPPAGSETTAMGWHVAPDGMRDILLEIQRRYLPSEIVITENGAAYNDVVDSDGSVRDVDRQVYLYRHVAAMADARDAGVPVTGYHVWSPLDNFEWSFGYTKRFGLIRVDFETQRRTIKQSGHWYGSLIAQSK
ncbi:MAG: GH1 family beta-glucosidase [Candidatus Limnocylindrales bacterium]